MKFLWLLVCAVTLGGVFSVAAGNMPFTSTTAQAAAEIEQWDFFELALPGPADGNPFLDVTFTARFAIDAHAVEAIGFYDGQGVYRVRFMRDRPGRWAYVTRSNVRELDGKTGGFTTCRPSLKNHGPVRVSNRFHFAYADGTPYRQIGTTCYSWVHRSDVREEQTLRTLAASPFNKIRMCVFPLKTRRRRTNAISHSRGSRPETGMPRGSTRSSSATWSSVSVSCATWASRPT